MTSTYTERLAEILPLVERPGRYIGEEWNAVRKEGSGSSRPTRVALAFPDTYEIGMSHLGMKILYEICNAHPDVACERVFAPWTDMEAEMRRRGLPLLSMESRTPVSEFDVLGFSLQYELSYTNVLAMLDLAGLALRSEDRRASDPLVIAGGPCAFNPEPVAPFIDVFVLGDAEDALLELTLELRAWRAAGLSRREMLEQANRKRECYVPLLSADRLHERTGIRHVPRVWVMKRTLKDVDKAPYPTKLVVPYTEVIHDRVVFEVSRGCQVGCRFCQAGIIYRPARDREVQTLMPIVEQSLRNTGYDEIALLSLNAGGYPHIHEVAKSLVERYRGDNVAVGLSSLRAPLLTQPLAEAVGQIRKTGFTIAAECGTERLRKIINKNIRHEDVIQAAHNAYGSGWSLIKLYFMIGLPTETMDDVDAIVALGREVLEVGRKYGGRARVNLGVSSFVPKPHTPFQWLPMERPEVLVERQQRLYQLTRNTPMKVKGHVVEQSVLECVLSRGDRSVARAVEAAFRRGLRFDGWGERFDYDGWLAAFRDAEVDPDIYCYGDWGKDDPLPWDHIRTGVFKGFLYEELEKGLAVEETLECGPDLCFSCGPCSKDFLTDLKERRSQPYPEVAGEERLPKLPAAFTYRVTYRKAGLLRFLSHLDLVRTWSRIVHRAALPMANSQGFHPLPKISLGPALPVGAAGDAELVDLELRTYVEAADVRARLATAVPESLAVVDVVELPADAPSITSIPMEGSVIADVSALGISDEEIAARVRAFEASAEVWVPRSPGGEGSGERRSGDKRGGKRRGGDKGDVRDLRKLVTGAEALPPGRLAYRVRIAPSGSVSPFVALAGILGIDYRVAIQARVTRTSLTAIEGSLAPAPSRAAREPIYA